MTAEQRKLRPQAERRLKRPAVKQQPKGLLQLYVDDQCLKVARIRDVSFLGVSLMLDRHIAENALVRLTYADKGVRIEVRGAVVWRKVTKNSDGQKYLSRFCWIGISLDPQDMDANKAFYNAIIGAQ